MYPINPVPDLQLALDRDLVRGTLWHASNCLRLMGRQIDETTMLGYVTARTQAEIDYWNEWARSMSGGEDTGEVD